VPSKRFQSLEARISTLGDHFLRGKLTHTTIALQTEEQERLRAFRVLCHAEVESALEDISEAAADAAVGHWLSHRQPRRIVVGLVLAKLGFRVFDYWDGHATPSLSVGRPLFPAGLSGPVGTDPSSDMVQEALRAYRRSLRGNHGVKSANIIQVVGPLGLRESDLASGWLAEMDSFGTLRGETAHSSAIAATKLLAVTDEEQRVARAVSGLRHLDAVLRRISSK